LFIWALALLVFLSWHHRHPSSSRWRQAEAEHQWRPSLVLLTQASATVTTVAGGPDHRLGLRKPSRLWNL